MPASCKCANGHTWTARVVEDSPEINAMEVEPSICAECESDDVEIIEVFSDYPDPEDD